MYDKQYAKTWYERNKDKVKQKVRERYEAKKEQILAKKKEYRDAHKEEEREQSREWYKNNKEKHLAKCREYRLEHLEEEKEYKHNYYLKNKEKCLEHSKKSWQKTKQKRKQNKMEQYNRLAKRYEHVSIPKYDDLYQAFENGLVWNARQSELRFMKTYLDQLGYNRICSLTDKDGEKHNERNCRLIASAFDDRSLDELELLDCHHCNLKRNDDSIQNLVFLPENIHLYMHKNFTDEQIKDIGQQVKHLRGSEKTKQFIRIFKMKIKKFINSL